MAELLKSCPFCGSIDVWRETSTDVPGIIRHRIRCRDCWCGTRWLASAEEAIAIFNCRAPAPQSDVVERVAQIIAADWDGNGDNWGNLDYGQEPFRETARAVLRALASPAPAEPTVLSGEEALAREILAELQRARAKFPGDNMTTLALVEEVGELAKATFEEPRERVRKEAVQVAAMAMRVVLDGDSTLDGWRATKGLDPLLPPPPSGATETGGAE